MFKGHIAGVLSLQFSTGIIGVQYTLANVSGRGHKFLAWCMPLSDYSTGGRFKTSRGIFLLYLPMGRKGNESTISEIFQVSLDERINSGTPTRGESLILENTARGKECSEPEQLLT